MIEMNLELIGMRHEVLQQQWREEKQRLRQEVQSLQLRVEAHPEAKLARSAASGITGFVDVLFDLTTARHQLVEEKPRVVLPVSAAVLLQIGALLWLWG